eukprot:3665180-Prymnesium_polylepis.1
MSSRTSSCWARAEGRSTRAARSTWYTRRRITTAAHRAPRTRRTTTAAHRAPRTPCAACRA